MAKFPRIPKLNKKERQELLMSFCEALTSIKNAKEAAQFLTDLLGPQELEMLAKRLQIAKLLTEGQTYEKISMKLKSSYGTIARVNAWLTLSGEGFRLVIKRSKKTRGKSFENEWDERHDPYSWHNIKRRYSMYFLPELIIEEIIKKSNKKQKEQLVSILDSIGSKPELFQEMNEKFREQYKRIRKRAVST